MKHSSQFSSGQQKVTVSAAQLLQIAYLCDLVQQLRALLEAILYGRRRLDQTAVLDGHKLAYEGHNTARQVASELGITGLVPAF